MDAMEKPIRLSDREELDGLLEREDRVLVDFYTQGCTLCQSLEPVLGNVARETDATVAMLNPRDALGVVEEFNIRSVPTLVFFEDSEPVDRLAEGFQGTDAVLSFVDG
ncbi:co-chaperone YbbN [Halolamina sp.]|jgi:thioredoxin-like negative regulator of GroEL|uniref:thioredoxin family protein n=1 Tax=Halolamina sp. TaxID=1940283 RepID=UPI000223BA9D|nr:Thioredoxin domain-containing protein [halophilic archaeon DL31]